MNRKKKKKHHFHRIALLVIDKVASVFKVNVVCLLQGSQEKGLSQASGLAKAVGVVSRPGAGDIAAMEGGHWTAG